MITEINCQKPSFEPIDHPTITIMVLVGVVSGVALTLIASTGIKAHLPAFGMVSSVFLGDIACMILACKCAKRDVTHAVIPDVVEKKSIEQEPIPGVGSTEPVDMGNNNGLENQHLLLDFFRLWEKSLALSVQYETLPVSELSQNEKTSQLSQLYQERDTHDQKVKNAAWNIYQIFKNLQLKQSIESDQLAAQMKMDVQSLMKLFTIFSFPSVSQKDAGCLNVFFACLVDCTGQKTTKITPNLTLLVEMGDPLWPENKIPGDFELTLEEFSLFLGISSDLCRNLLKQWKSDIETSRLTRKEMKEFCVWVSRTSFKKQSLCYFSGKFNCDYSRKWTRARQLELIPHP